MEINEIKECQKRMNEQIKEILNTFNKKTGMIVENVRIEQRDVSGKVYNVETEVKL